MPLVCDGWRGGGADSLGGAGQEVRQQDAVHNMAEACLVTKVRGHPHTTGDSQHGDQGDHRGREAQDKALQFSRLGNTYV